MSYSEVFKIDLQDFTFETSAIYLLCKVILALKEWINLLWNSTMTAGASSIYKCGKCKQEFLCITFFCQSSWIWNLESPVLQCSRLVFTWCHISPGFPPSCDHFQLNYTHSHVIPKFNASFWTTLSLMLQKKMHTIHKRADRGWWWHFTWQICGLRSNGGLGCKIFHRFVTTSYAKYQP